MTESPGPSRPASLVDVLWYQRASCEQLGSALYAALLDTVIADVRAGGPCAGALRPHEGEPFGTMLPLRFLGAIHRLVLTGRAPRLAAHYPSAGGRPGPTLAGDFLATVAELPDEIEALIPLGVQTNEVGRSAALVGGLVEVARRSRLPLRVLELGASAGLNLRWDQFFYDTGESRFGDPDSPVRFAGVWEGRPPRLDDVPVEVVDRAGCDRSPVDAASEEGRRTLRAYVWADQVERYRRLEGALEVAARVPATVEAADLGDWVEARLAESEPGVATVVVHSIVWQYVARPARDRLRAALRRAGEEAPPGGPVAWLRMEPAGVVTDVRLTMWPDGREEVLGTAGYHGAPVWWGAASPRG